MSQEKLTPLVDIDNIDLAPKVLENPKCCNLDYESCYIGDIAKALCAAQGEFPTIYKNRKGQFSYADLDAIMKVIRPILAKNGLSITQQEYESPEGSAVLHTKLMHSSGQWLKSKKKVGVVKLRNEHQDYGSALKYYRRYSIESLLGLSVSDDFEDDDGDNGSYTTPSVQYKAPSQPKPEEYISTLQVNNIVDELDGYPAIHDYILQRLKVDSISKIPAKHYQATIDEIRKKISTLEQKKS